MKKYSFGPYSESNICFKGNADNDATGPEACSIVVDAVIPVISAIATIFAIVFTWMNKRKEAAAAANAIVEEGIQNTTYADVETAKSPEPITAKSPEPMTISETKSPEPQSPNRSRKSSKRSSVKSTEESA